MRYPTVTCRLLMLQKQMQSGNDGMDQDKDFLQYQCVFQSIVDLDLYLNGTMCIMHQR